MKRLLLLLILLSVSPAIAAYNFLLPRAQENLLKCLEEQTGTACKAAEQSVNNLITYSESKGNKACWEAGVLASADTSLVSIGIPISQKNKLRIIEDLGKMQESCK